MSSVEFGDIFDGDVELQRVVLLHDKVLKDPSLFNDEFVKSLISFVGTIRFEQQEVEVQELLVKSFDVLIDRFNFDQVVEIVSTNEIIHGFELTNNTMILSSLCKLVLKASPIDLWANTELIKVLMQKLESVEEIGVVSIVENLILELSELGELIRRRLVSKEIVSMLKKLRNSSIDRKVRLFDLISNVYLSFLHINDDFPIDFFFQFTNEEVMNDDIMYPISILNYYNGVLTKINQRNLVWILPNLRLDPFIEMLVNDEEYIFKNFIMGELTLLIGKLSHFHEYFHQLDSRFNIVDRMVNDDFQDPTLSTRLLSIVDPILLKDSSSFLNNLTLNTKNIPIWLNLISNEEIFVQLDLNSNSFKKIPSAEDLFVLLEKMSEFKWSSVYLLQHLPATMNQLLDSQIINTEILNMKITILKNLLQYSSSYKIWNDKILLQLNSLVSFTPQVTVDTI